MVNRNIQNYKGVMVNKEWCKKILEGSNQCRAYALKDSEYCIFHDERPEIAKIREDASKLAGLSQKILFPKAIEGKLPIIAKPVNIKKARDIKKAIVRTLQEIRFGNLDIEIGRTLLYGLNVLINAIDKIEILQRIEKLEQIAKEKGIIG